MAIQARAVSRPMRQKLITTITIALSSTALIGLWTTASYAGGTRVAPGQSTRVFVMAGFTPDCGFKGFPDIQVTQTPAKGQVAFKPGEATTIQYSLSGKCVGTQIQGTGIYYQPAVGQTGDDTFTVSGRLGNGEPATRTFSVIIDEKGNIQ